MCEPTKTKSDLQRNKQQSSHYPMRPQGIRCCNAWSLREDAARRAARTLSIHNMSSV